MGHYDECYEADARDQAKKEEKEAKKELQALVDDLSQNQRLIAIKLLKNIDSIRGMLNFLRNVL